jgi:SOS-response transcriptional repressor LexA
MREIRKSLKQTQEQFGSKIGVRQAQVADWERGRTAPSLDAMNNIVKCYSINLHWLLTGNGTMHLPSFANQEHQLELKDKVFNFIRNELNTLENDKSLTMPQCDEFWYMPITGEISAGDPKPFNFTEDISQVAISKRHIKNPTLCEVLRVNGDSMEPEIKHSDLAVILRETDLWMCHDKVVAVRTPEGLTLKKLMVDFLKNSGCLIPFNSKYPVLFVSEDCSILGYLVYIIRKY